MESVLLKLEIKYAGNKGKLGQFLKDIKSRPSPKSASRKMIHATVYVQDDSDFSKVYSTANKELINWIRSNKPASVYEMAKELGKDLSNLSKTVRALAEFSLIRLEEGESVRRTLTPFVDWDQLEVLFPAAPAKVSKKRAA